MEKLCWVIFVRWIKCQQETQAVIITLLRIPDAAPRSSHEVLPHGSTSRATLKTSHPPVTHRVALMLAIPSPASPHNKPATGYKAHPKTPWEKPPGRPPQEPHKGPARDAHRTWTGCSVSDGEERKDCAHSPSKVPLAARVSGFLNSLSLIYKHKLTVFWKRGDQTDRWLELYKKLKRI